MFEIFNMGIGLRLQLNQKMLNASRTLDEPVYEIGRILKKDGASVVIK